MVYGLFEAVAAHPVVAVGVATWLLVLAGMTLGTVREVCEAAIDALEAVGLVLAGDPGATQRAADAAAERARDAA